MGEDGVVDRKPGIAQGNQEKSGLDIAQLCESELRLVELAARQTHRALKGFVEFDELVSAGREGLFEAARRFEATHGIPFGAYANYRVRGAILDAVRKVSGLPRDVSRRLAAIEALQALGAGSVEHVYASEGSVLAREDYVGNHVASAAVATALAVAGGGGTTALDELRSDPEEVTAQRELMALVRLELDELGPNERDVIYAKYFEDQDFVQIGEQLNCSKSWACRVHARAVERLGKRLAQVV
jgi:RNA polymerase sigma factor for flagellar operon FliA